MMLPTPQSRTRESFGEGGSVSLSRRIRFGDAHPCSMAFSSVTRPLTIKEIPRTRTPFRLPITHNLSPKRYEEAGRNERFDP